MSFTDLSLYDCWRCGEYGHDRSSLAQSDVGDSSSHGLWIGTAVLLVRKEK